jgi:NAD(P)-dependent dehydrogenase (short-subunit alcohol dehydrogenase family)
VGIQLGRVAIVTGSTSGIGAEIARRLGEAGARVAVTGHDETRGREVVHQITRAGGEAVFFARDLEEAGTPGRLVEETASAFGGVDILVNNGGALMAAPTPEVDAETFDRAFRLNVRSAFLLVGAAAPLMAEWGRGRIISISSVSGQWGSAGLALYGATKAALEQLTRSWAAEFGPRGVAVNCVASGRVLTPFSEKNLGLSDPETRTRAEANIPAGRIARAGDVAAAALFLAGEEAGYVQGVVLNVDGGLAIFQRR